MFLCFVWGFFLCQGLIMALILSSWTNHMSPQCTFTQSKLLLLSNVWSGVGARACLFPSSVAEKKRRPIYPGGSGSMSEQTSSGVVASPFLYHTGTLCPTFTVHSLQTMNKFVELCFYLNPVIRTISRCIFFFIQSFQGQFIHQLKSHYLIDFVTHMISFVR